MDQQIEAIVKRKLDEIKGEENIHEYGRVSRVQGYVLEVRGLQGVQFYEKVRVGTGGEGYVNNIKTDCVLIAMTRTNGKIYINDPVVPTGEVISMQFAEDAMGHVVDIFGTDRLNGRVFENLRSLNIENKNIPIVDRLPVNRALETGITGIDLIYPIGKGQRQLIIGDKKTGKTQLLLDAIVNQKGKDVICIYMPIGKTKKKVKEVYADLMNRGAMEYTIIVCAFNDDTPPSIYLTPYAGMSIAEYYLQQGKDVLVCIDDLSSHAKTYREISLLAGKVPGRDAYPPDIFYTHSRLLEKGCQYKNGGSITILPVVETKGGDITDYISTNIISITDGQIVLSKKNFDKGEKPAINYGLSVSRLGGAVQSPEVKKTGTKVKRDLLSYLETRSVYELANVDEMSLEMQNKLKRGSMMLDALRQYKYSPLPSSDMIERFDAIYKQFE